MDRIAPVIKKHGYVPKRKIGFGSFGQAWLVNHDGPDGKHEYVCKMIDISRCSKKERADALHEAKVLKELKHPYIVRYNESFLEDGWLCIVQEYCEGGDLYQKIQKGKKLNRPFAEDRIIRWFTQCILGLKYIHEKHILHRDLKSSNFFLTKDDTIKMGDFGIAKVLECTAGAAKTQIGTPYYLSPEICQEKPYAWPSDIWAMGCILYELCCLRVPFDAADLRALVHRITRGPSPQLPHHFSGQLRQLVSDILIRDHTRRPTAAAILAKPILQKEVRQMLGEDEGGSKEKETPLQPMKPEAPEKKAGSALGPHGDAAGKYVKNQIVEYYSETHKEWLPAQVTGVDDQGRIQVHCKPNAWLSLNVQANKVRPRQKDSSQPDNKENKPKPPSIPGKEHGGRASSNHTPRYYSGAATPPVGGAHFRGQTPPGYRAQSPSPFGINPGRAGSNTPRLAYGRPNYVNGVIGTPRGTPRGAAVGTPRGSDRGNMSPSVRPPFSSNSPRFNPGGMQAGGGYPQNYRYY